MSTNIVTTQRRKLKSYVGEVLIPLVSVFMILKFHFTETQYSLLMCTNFVYVLWKAWMISKLSPFFLFLCTFCLLFIGGHFWGNLFNHNLSIRVGSFMEPSVNSDSEWIKTLIYIVLFLYASLFGYERYRNKHDLSTDNSVFWADNRGRFLRCNRILSILFYPLAAIGLYNAFQSLLLILQNGYTAIYLSQGEDYSSNSLMLVLTSFFFAVAMVYGNAKNRVMYSLMMFLNALVGILGGGRGAFGAFMLLAIWVTSMKYRFNLKKLFIGGIVALSSLLIMSQMSQRSKDAGIQYDTISNILGLFIYSQGESLAIFEKSREYTYPILPYVQTFIPGSSFLYSHLFDSNLKNYEASFSLNLSYKMNSRMFYDGYGTGWTLISDLFLFSGRTWIGYIILSYLWGLLMAMLEYKSKYDLLYRVILFAIFLNLMILPRAGLNYICPLIVYILILYAFMSNICRLSRR